MGLVLANEGAPLLLDMMLSDLSGGLRSPTLFVRLFSQADTVTADTTYAQIATITAFTLRYLEFETARDGLGDATLFFQGRLVTDDWQTAVRNPAGDGGVKLYDISPVVWFNRTNSTVTAHGYYVFAVLPGQSPGPLLWAEEFAAPMVLKPLDVCPVRIKFGLKPSA